MQNRLFEKSALDLKSLKTVLHKLIQVKFGHKFSFTTTKNTLDEVNKYPCLHGQKCILFEEVFQTKNRGDQ